MNKIKYFSQWSWPILLGICAFVFVTGGKIIWPSYIDWLLKTGDTATSFFAWQFFRNTPLLQNPLGANYPYGMEMGGAMIYAETLLLFAFPLKLLSNILPTPFQYMGSWLLLCFILQAIFSWELLAKITRDNWLKFFASTFFVLAPPLLWRLHGHPQLLGQWLILAGILLYLSPNYKNYKWATLLCVASLVFPYFLLMLLVLWAADLMKRIILVELTYQEVIKTIFITSLILLAIIWQEGYFMLRQGMKMDGLGYYRMNLLSLINPSDISFNTWSHILKNQPETAGDYEGFNYLGLGVIILSSFALFKLIDKFASSCTSGIDGLVFDLKKILPFLPLFLVCLLLTLLALSNRIVLGQHELMQYTLPDIVKVFRASGRMFWPVYYILYLSIFYLIFKYYKGLLVKSLLLVCLLIQLLDSQQVYSYFRNSLSHVDPYVSSLQSNFWLEAAKKYKKIIYVLPDNLPEEWETLVHYAAFNGLAINIGYFARTDSKKINSNKNKLIDAFLHGHLDKEALYIVQNKVLRRFIVTKVNLPYKVGSLDGFFFLAPNWTSSSSEFERASWAGLTAQDSYKLGSLITFATPESNAKDYLFTGWSFPEGKATWTNSDKTSLLINFFKRPSFDAELTINALPYINAKHPKLEADIFANQQYIGHLLYTLSDSTPIRKMTIPSYIFNKSNLLEIEFIFKNSTSPLKLGLSDDPRKLGLYMVSIAVNKTIT